MLQPYEVNYVIYHGGCQDGFASAFCAWRYFSLKGGINNITFKSAQYGDLPPSDLIGRNVLICDFSYHKDAIKEIMSTNRLLIIDHHKSSMKNLSGVPSDNKIFDMDHSGCYLTWKYFFPEQIIPPLFEYIEDNDIWKKQLDGTNEFYSWFQTVEMKFEEYDKYIDPQLLRWAIQTTGFYYLAHDRFFINQAIKKATLKLVSIARKYYVAAFVNSSILKSEIGNEVLKAYPQADFAAIYSVVDKRNATNFSLRSMDDRADVSEIAEVFGGGGHRNASGLRIGYVVDFIGEVYGDYKLITDANVEYDDTGKTIKVLAGSNSRHLGKYYLQKMNKNVIRYEKAICSTIDFKTHKQQDSIVFESSLSTERIIALYKETKVN